MKQAFAVLILCLVGAVFASAQQITGVWRGKINNQRVEVKIIQRGDSLLGTSYYSPLTGGGRRYSIKGHFDHYSNSVIWWDDELISGRETNPNMSVADFNCPGGNRMFLDGKSSPKEDRRKTNGEVSLVKVTNPTHRDEWDFVLENFSRGTNHPYIIDSISKMALVKTKPQATPSPNPIETEPAIAKTRPAPKPAPSTSPVIAPVPVKAAAPKQTIEEMFTTRKRVVTKEIAIAGDSLSLHFYDNAEVDGDSITLYLNNRMIFTHVRLAATPFVVTLPVNELAETNELVMVAENLGSIPPNTAFMLALVGGKRYEAHLESTEGTSSVIVFRKEKQGAGKD